MFNYILLYFALGLPIALMLAFVSGRDTPGKRVMAGLVLWLVWPLVPVAMIREHLALKHINLKCAWCGDTVTTLSNALNRELWAAHHRQCPQHPLRPEIERSERAENEASWAGHWKAKFEEANAEAFDYKAKWEHVTEDAKRLSEVSAALDNWASTCDRAQWTKADSVLFVWAQAFGSSESARNAQAVLSRNQDSK